MKTRSSGISSIGVPASKAHVLQRALVAVALRVGNGVADPDDHLRGRAPRDHRADLRDVDLDLGVEARALVAAQLAPAGEQFVPVAARGRGGTALDPLEGRLVGGDHARAATALDRHVADRHAALHRQPLDRRSRVLDDVADRAGDSHLSDRREDQVLRGDAEAELAVVADAHRASACAAPGTASPGRARPRWCRCRTRARRTHRVSRCGCRRRRSSCRAG